MLAALPLDARDLTIRQWTRDDLDQLAAWPAYPFPYEAFGFSFADASCVERDRVFEEREGDPARITLVVCRDEAWVGYLALLAIDWKTGTVGNLGIRIHPERCGHGIGSLMLRAVIDWGVKHGLDSFRLDVAASNPRAIRCYEKAGFQEVGELWRPAPDLKDLDLSQAQYDFLRPHIRFPATGEAELRFLTMEVAVLRSMGGSRAQQREA